MAFGNIVGAEPVDLGNGVPAYNFLTRDGQSVMLFDKEAEELKARLDASEGLMPQKTAFAAPRLQLTTVADVPQQDPGLTALATATERAEKKAAGAIELPPGNINPESPGSWGAGETPRAPPGTTLVRTPDGGAVALPEPTPVQANGDVIQEQRQQGPQAQRIGYGMIKGPDGIIYEQTPGTRGVSQKDWERKRAQTTMMPTGTRTTVEGAIPPDPDFVAGMRELSADRSRMLEEAAKQAVAVADQERALQQAEYDKQTAAAREQQRLVDETQARVQQFEQTKNKLREDANAAKVDPNRLFSGGTGALRAIGSAIAAAMGQYAAAMTHSPNAALAIIDGAIDRDIRAQEGEIVTKKEAAQNALADYMREGLSLNQAKLVLKQNMFEQASSQRRLISLNNAPKEIMAMEEQMQNAETERLIRFEEQYRRDSMGRATEEVSSVARYPQAGSPGGIREVSAPRVKAAMEATGEAQKLFRGPGGGAELKNPQARQLAADLVEINRLRDELKNIPRDEPLADIPNQWVPTRARQAVQDFAMGKESYVRGLPESQKRLISLQRRIRENVTAINSTSHGMGVLRETEYPRAVTQLETAGSFGEVSDNLDNMAVIIKGKLDAITGAPAGNEVEVSK